MSELISITSIELATTILSPSLRICLQYISQSVVWPPFLMVVIHSVRLQAELVAPTLVLLQSAHQYMVNFNLAVRRML